MSNNQKYRPIDGEWAVVTGASSGIGYGFARQLANWGWSVVLVSNQAQQLEQCASNIEKEFHTQTKTLYLDLSQPTSAQELFDFCNDINVAVLVNNAGIFTFAQFNNLSEKTIDLYLKLHIETVTKLCYLFSARMKEQKRGFILNMSSLAAYWSLPGVTMYEATKSYIRTFSRALRYELLEYGVSVTVLTPGGITTDLFGLNPSLLKLGANLGALIRVEKFAKIALKAMFRRRKERMPGFINRITIPLVAILPKWSVNAIKKWLAKYENPR